MNMKKISLIRFFQFLLLLLILSGCSTALIAREGDELSEKGAWDEAVLKYREAYGKEPGNLDYRMKYSKARFESALVHYARGEEELGKGNHEAALLEFQASLILDPSLDKSRGALNKTKKLMDSLYYYGKGIEALKGGEEREAKAAFKKALTLNPGNEAASVELEKMRKEKKVVLDGYELDLKSSAPITIEFKDAGVRKVFEVITRLSGINFVYDPEVRDERTTLALKNATFQQALDLILMTNRLSRKVVSENTIIIYPSTAQKAAQYDEMMIRVFYLSNSDAKKTVNLLRTMIKARDITVHEELNAIVVRARPEAIDLAQKILDSTDLADAEVMFEVNIIEINRNKASNLGLDLSPDTVTAAVPASGGTMALRDLRKIASGDLLIGLPSAILNIKKEDLDANILANPRIRVKNNSKAKIHIGSRVPIITTTVNQGVTTENIQYQDVGLKLSVEPVVRKGDEVDLKLGLEVSSLGTKTTTTSGSVAYEIGTRNTETVLRLRDGETQIFGGLISDEERKTVKKIPLLGDIPAVGRLFANVDGSTVKTEVLLSITPRIIRRVEVPEEAAGGFMSGRDEYPSTRPLLESFSADVEAVPPPPFQPPFSPEEAIGPGVECGPPQPPQPPFHIGPPPVQPFIPTPAPPPPSEEE